MQESIGNIELLKKRKIGFLAPSHVAPLAVLPTLDWATEIAERDDVTVMSGFSSQTERDVLSFLKKGKCGIILVLARCHYKRLPEELQSLLDTNRLLIIPTSTADRQSKAAAYHRNKFICENADETICPAKPIETSSLYELFNKYIIKSLTI